MSLVLAGMLATAQVLPFIDRSELRSVAALEAGHASGARRAPQLASRVRKSSATLCSVATRPSARRAFMVGAGDGPIISASVMAVLVSACGDRPATHARTKVAAFAAR